MGLMKNYKGLKKQHQNDMWGVQEELALSQNGKEEKKANTMEGTKLNVCNKEGHWGNKCHTLLPAEQAQKKKDCKEQWESTKKKIGQQHTQVGEVLDADWRNCDCGVRDVEYGFSMLAADKKKASETMQTSPPNYKKVTTAFPRIVYTWTAVQHTFPFSTLIS